MLILHDWVKSFQSVLTVLLHTLSMLMFELSTLSCHFYVTTPLKYNVFTVCSYS